MFDSIGNRITYHRASFQMARCMGRRDHRGVIRATTALLEADPRDTFAMTVRASAYEALGDVPEGRRIWQRVLEREPENFDVLCSLAESYARSHEYAPACGAIRRALQAERPIEQPSRFERAFLSVLAILSGKPGLANRLRDGVQEARERRAQWRAWGEHFLSMHASGR